MNLLEIFHSFFECNFFFSKYIFTSLFISDKKRENTNSKDYCESLDFFLYLIYYSYIF